MPRAQLHHNDTYAIAFSKGNEQALAWFFNAYYTSLCITANHYTQNMEVCKEIVAEAFCKTWQYRRQFTKAVSIRAYLYTVVRNDAIRYNKTQQSFRSTALQRAELLNTSEETVFDVIVRAETAQHLHKAIATLPPQCRKVFEMLFIKDKTIGETAAALHLASSTVRAHKTRGLEVLRRILSPGAYLLLCNFF